jgi:hypothetical protein
MAIDSALGRLGAKAGVCTSSTRPVNPFEGQIIYESDTNRTLIYDNSAWLVIADNQMLSIDTANSRVGINNTSPATAFHLKYGAGSGLPTISPAHVLVVDSDDQSGVGIYSGTTNDGYMRFGDADDSAVGGFQYDHAVDELYIRANGANKATVDTDGVHLGNTTTAAGKWVSYTPALEGSTTDPTYTVANGYYFEIGEWVIAQIIIGNFTSAGSGTFYVTTPTNIYDGDLRAVGFGAFSNGNTRYPVTLQKSSSAANRAFMNIYDGSIVNSTNPFVAGSGDYVRVQMMYERA